MGRSVFTSDPSVSLASIRVTSLAGMALGGVSGTASAAACSLSEARSRMRMRKMAITAETSSNTHSSTRW
jgi:hypothetical protein